MQDADIEHYESLLREKDERIAALMEQLGDAITLLEEIRSMTNGV
jgi:hypothetical protein